MSRSADRAAKADEAPAIRKNLCGEAQLRIIRARMAEIPDHRRIASVRISLVDVLMSGFAIFSMKFSSLLQFEEQARKNEKDAESGEFSSNLKTLFGVKEIPSDTQTREILDEVYPETLRPAFNDLFHGVQRGGELKQFHFYKDHYLLSMDGTGCFSSSRVHCASCMKKVLKAGKKREKTQVVYYHQMMAGALVHPEQKVVLPFCPEPILKQDGHEKND